MRPRKEVFGWSGRGKHQINGDDSLILKETLHTPSNRTRAQHRHSLLAPQIVKATHKKV
ncbi:hypothetical protein FA13DRAFT_932919 [Coprinellus micaceus]|uniref:Uncharacterized protein n=1 Tax=Coprinellus micaceus TaxID=71717 RepID=A0A4Y7SZV1_COPMI|nr:hypothetical protein FA13DRAFT_932919 [Coprinellus micaceus]